MNALPSLDSLKELSLEEIDVELVKVRTELGRVSFRIKVLSLVAEMCRTVIRLQGEQLNPDRLTWIGRTFELVSTRCAHVRLLSAVFRGSSAYEGWWRRALNALEGDNG